MGAAFLWTFLLACISSWDLVEGEEVDVGCDVQVFYTDADGDGWGAKPLAGEELDEGCALAIPVGKATNTRDCCDAGPCLGDLVNLGGDHPDQAEIGPSLDGFCPDQLGEETLSWVDEGLGRAYTLTLAEGVHTASDAEALCQLWTGIEDGLAVLETVPEAQSVLNHIDGELDPNTYIWVALKAASPPPMPQGDDVECDEGDAASASFIESTDWTWRGLNDSSSASALGWCEGKPALEDFYPLVEPRSCSERKHFIIAANRESLALRYEGNKSGCYGVPHEVITGAAGDERWLYQEKNLVLCERAAFPVVIGEEGDTGESTTGATTGGSTSATE